MRQTAAVPRKMNKDAWLIPPAILLGVALGLFVNGYWLIDYLPAGSRLLLLLTAAAIAVGIAGFYLLLRWVSRRLMQFSAAGIAMAVAAALAIGLATTFGGTSQWLTSARYVSILLPSHQMQINVSGGTANPGVALMWFHTSLGDVSYDTIHFSGWKRVGEELVLQDPGAARLEWTGRVGDNVQIVLRESGGQNIVISWDGRQETLAPTTGKFTYSHSFAIPWYASGQLVLAAGVLTFGALALVLILLLWDPRNALFAGVRQSLSQSAGVINRADALAILGSILLALLLRLPNLGGPYPPVDEYFHLIAARQIVEGAALGSVYERGLWIVTIPVSLALRVFGNQLWAARLPGLLINVLAIFPLYLLTRKINRPVAVLAAILYATSPWIVTFARITREYAYYPFYFYWIVFGMIVLIEAIPHDFVLLRDWKRLFTTRIILLGCALLLPPVFALYGDRLSTFGTILIAYPAFGIFLLARFNFKDRSNWPVFAVLAVGLAAAIYGEYVVQQAKLLIVPAFNPVPVEYFLPNPQQQWYYDQLAPVVVLALLGVVLLGYFARRTNFIPLFFLSLFAAYLTFFAFFSRIFFHTRHLLTTELWFIILVAIAGYLAWKALVTLNPWKKRYAGLLLAAALWLSFINVQQILAPVTSTDPRNPISEDYLHDFSQVHAFMLAHAQPDDVLISTVYGLYSSWMEAPHFAERHRITTDTPRDQISAMIAQHPSGWIVMDQIRFSMSTLGLHEFAGNPDVEYIGMFGDEYVWHWKHPSAGPGN